MKNEVNIFYNALSYYSRIPVPKSLESSHAILAKAYRYLPLVGIILASLGAFSFILASFIFPKALALLIALSLIMLLTGCLHEDGLADFFDGFGGGHSQESILNIMKDSQIGSYGVLALMAVLALKFTALFSIGAEQIPCILIAAHSISRAFPLLIIKTLPYARKTPNKAEHARKGIDNLSLSMGLIIGIIPLIFFSWKFTAVYLILSIFFCKGFSHYLRKRLGGFTGDTLGALQQFTEVLFYLVFLALI